MDSVVALAVMSADLQTSRIHSVNATIAADNISPNVMSGGFIAAQTNVKLAESEAGSSVISSITLKIEGFPKGVKQESAKIGDRVFCVEVTAQGVYSWDKKQPRSAIHHPDLAHALGRPMYVLAASEIREIALKMGFTGVHIDADIPRAQEEGVETLPLQSPKSSKTITHSEKENTATKKPARKRTRSSDSKTR